MQSGKHADGIPGASASGGSGGNRTFELGAVPLAQPSTLSIASSAQQALAGRLGARLAADVFVAFMESFLGFAGILDRCSSLPTGPRVAVVEAEPEAAGGRGGQHQNAAGQRTQAHAFGAARSGPVLIHRAMAISHPLVRAIPFAMPTCVARVAQPHEQWRRDVVRTGWR